MKISYIFGAQRQPTLRMILTLFLLMLGGLLLTNVTGALLMKVASFSTALKWTTVVQNLLAFVFPALVVGFMYVLKPMYYLGVANRPSLLAMAGVAAVYVLMTPAMNTLIAWNENWTLPAAFSELETVLRSQEESARQMTEQLLDVSSFGSMLMTVLYIGVLTGICEELFFRGALQRILQVAMPNAHMAVWTSALVFSVLHFQSFGLVPRMCLGAFFGYMFLWSGSLWPAILGHVMNNSLVVIFTYMEKNGILDSSMDKLGTEGEAAPMIAAMSAVLTVVTMVWLGRKLKKSHKECRIEK